jgi:hypothetical protein
MAENPQIEEARGRLAAASIDFLVTVGLVASVMPRYPEDVQENFVEKIDEVTDAIVMQMEEFTGFGEALDDYVE